MSFTEEEIEMVRFIIEVLLFLGTILGAYFSFRYKKVANSLTSSEKAPRFNYTFRYAESIINNVKGIPENFQWEIQILHKSGILFISEKKAKTGRVDFDKPYYFDALSLAGYDKSKKDDVIDSVLFRTYYSYDIENRIRYCSSFIYKDVSQDAKKYSFDLKDKKLQTVSWCGVRLPRKWNRVEKSYGFKI